MQAQDRKLAELHFKIGLVLQFLQMPEEALNEIEAAISLCSKCLQPSDRVSHTSGAYFKCLIALSKRSRLVLGASLNLTVLSSVSVDKGNCNFVLSRMSTVFGCPLIPPFRDLHVS